jgi:DNA-binding MarR family transcriptional regulator
MPKSKFVKIKFDLTKQNLSLNESLVLSYLSSLTKKEFCYASNDHLSDTLNINSRTLYRVLNKLESKNLIRRETHSTGHYGKDRKIYVNPSVKLTYLSI